MIKHFINSLFLALLALPLVALAKDNSELGFIDGVWQIYGSPHYQSEPAPEPGQYFSLHYEQKSGLLVLVDLPSVEQGHPILMASYIGAKEPHNPIAPGVDSVCPKTHYLIIKQHVAYYFGKEDLRNSGQNCHK